MRFLVSDGETAVIPPTLWPNHPPFQYNVAMSGDLLQAKLYVLGIRPTLVHLHWQRPFTPPQPISLRDNPFLNPRLK
ncbi:MAG: hypothetical protein GY805_19220 [Chloroflexi bacterium]|nr:hypothetical protein [Chloroflexota bacterium]